jgi:uncharacterized protein
MKTPPSLHQKHQQVQALLSGYGRVAIAFSGGVDSTLLLKIAHDTLGENCLALFADSVVQPRAERDGAVTTAQTIGAALVQVPFAPLALPEFTANCGDRCYYCKKAIFAVFLHLAKLDNFPWLADGTNSNDLDADRPGLRAVAELGVKSPLADAGLTKEEIRLLSRALGLPTWDKPSASCLATRIPTHTPITVTNLGLVETAERFLHTLGYHGCRVRLLGSTFVLELAAGDIVKIARHEDFITVRAYLYSLGAEKVFLDLLQRASILT